MTTLQRLPFARSRAPVALLCLLTAGVAFALEPVGRLAGPFEVVRVIDGDTVELDDLGRVRLIGIDTPERNEGDKLDRKAAETGLDRDTIRAMGRAASEFTEDLLWRQPVWVEADVEARDDFGRLLAYLYLADPRGEWTAGGERYRQANLDIVRAGWAEPLTLPPNVAYAELFLAASREAREARLGMWAELAAERLGVEIACVLYNPDGRDEGAELVTLYARETTDVTDWRLADSDGNAIVLEGELEGGYEYDFGFDEAVWGNGGDTASLYDASGRLVDELGYLGGGRVACR